MGTSLQSLHAEENCDARTAMPDFVLQDLVPQSCHFNDRTDVPPNLLLQSFSETLDALLLECHAHCTTFL